jgi:hypothetical protein
MSSQGSTRTTRSNPSGEALCVSIAVRLWQHESTKAHGAASSASHSGGWPGQIRTAKVCKRGELILYGALSR